MHAKVIKKNYFCRQIVNYMKQKVTNCIKSCPFTSILVLVIWYLSLFTPPKTQLNEVHFIDKWAHLLMYGTLVCTLWIEHAKNHREKPGTAAALCLYLFPVLMSGLIELVQEYCTVSRSGDWYDFAANAAGGLIGAGFGYYFARWKLYK